MRPKVKRIGWTTCVKARCESIIRRVFLPWFRDVTMRYKERGVFPVLPSDLTHHYTEKRDKEAALLISLLIPYKGKVQRNIREMYDLIGPSPYKWLKDREYVQLTVGDSMNKLLFGSPRLPYWKLIPLFDEMARVIRKKNITEDDVLRISANPERLQLCLVVMFSSDGIGLGLREPTKPVRCPNTKELIAFMNFLIGDKCKEYEFDDMTELFFTNSVDFLYAYFAWKELKRMYPANMTYLEERYGLYLKWGGTFTDRWKNLIFEVDFNQ